MVEEGLTRGLLTELGLPSSIISNVFSTLHTPGLAQTLCTEKPKDSGQSLDVGQAGRRQNDGGVHVGGSSGIATATNAADGTDYVDTHLSWSEGPILSESLATINAAYREDDETADLCVDDGDMMAKSSRRFYMRPVHVERKNSARNSLIVFKPLGVGFCATN
ncbi:hypothetical protein CEUSTIGMA_g11597.t1 [Chlamydomonas eustigma]|uniref:Uncharacterized protein n=1 Tax=Chlamydomonas eustigma TaxID=1157962 RepID=A0A250XM64_9CHLO|nr:hypothetical protein CEUSTIGMA_g11597.t1 [Chlamydomonas eustigma]|eukprot:GAX84174.1 hypothetical protein CEUSTIGMA_g11597.t1 [Chlamydomonas eustigma]